MNKFALMLVLLVSIFLLSGCVSAPEQQAPPTSGGAQQNPSASNNLTPDYSQYETQPVQHELMFTRNLIVGKRETIGFTTYTGVDNYLANQNGAIRYDPNLVSEEVNDPVQDYYLRPLVDQIKALTPYKDEQARIAISVAQMIRYDYLAADTQTITEKYPYEVIHTEKGVCGEKSRLIIYLLEKLGFGTAYFVFEDEHHATAAIRCPKEYSYMNSGYCFVEATDVALVGQSNNLYVNVGQLSYHPTIYNVSDGLEYRAIITQVETAKQEVANGTRFAIVDASGAIIARIMGNADMRSTYPDVIIKYPNY
jgi:hypothetical protein